MPNGEEDGALSPQLTAALEELRQRLQRPETVRLAIKQYVVSEIVRALVDVDGGGGAAGSTLSLTATSEETSNSVDDDGTTTHCHTDTYTLFGHQLYSHQVCDQTAATGQGSITVTTH